jgi:hypothetical protein
MRVIQSSPSLIISDTPSAILGWALLAVALIAALLGFLHWADSQRTKYYWPALLMSLPFAAAGAWLFVQTTIVVDRASETLSVTDSLLGLRLGQRRIALGDIRTAMVSDQGPSQRLLVILQSGEAIPLTRSTDAAGHGTAAQAINEYLVRTALPWPSSTPDKAP